MAHFKRNKGKMEDDFSVDSILERAAESRNDAPPITGWDRRRERVRAPHALTLDELLGGKPNESEKAAAFPAVDLKPAAPARPVETIPMERTRPAPSSLYERMMQAKENPASVSPEEADLALKAFAAALPAEQDKGRPESAPADSLRARTRQFTQQAVEQERQPRRIPALDVGNVDDIIRRFEEKAHSRAVDLYGEAYAESPAQKPAAPIQPAPSPSSPKKESPSLFDWEKDEKENKNLPLYGPEADVQPLPTRRDRPVYQVSAEPVKPAQSAPPAKAEQASAAAYVPTAPAGAPARPASVEPPAPAPEPADSLHTPETIPTVRVTPVRKARRFTTPVEGGEAGVSKQDAQPLTVEVSALDGSDEQPVMTTAPTSSLPAPPAEPPKISKREPAEAVPAAAQFSFADGGLTAADQVYKKTKAPQKSSIDTSATELSSFSDPRERPDNPLGDGRDAAAAFLQKPIRKGSAAGRKATGGQDGSTIQFTLRGAPGQTPPAAGGPDPMPDQSDNGRGRKKRVVLFGDIEEENAPGEMPPEPEEYEAEEIDDYETTADAASVRADLKARSRRLKARALPTLVITLLLFLLASPLLDGFKAANLTVYLILSIALTCAAALINLNAMRGLGSLFSLRPDMDTPAALAVVGVLAHSLIMLATGNAADAPQLGGLAAMALLFNGVGKMTLLSRIRRNFELVADEDEKQAVLLLDDPDLTGPLADGSVIGEALICARRKTVHPQNFLRHSYCPDPYERVVMKISFAALALAVVAGVVAGFFVSLPAGVNLAAALLCLACPPTTLLLSNLPLSGANKRLGREGAMLTGYQSADELSYANAITFSADELFPAGTVKLFKMHLLSANPIDEAILQAASVARKARSPIYSVFRQMLDGDAGLPQADSVTYEDRMGLSGWIGKTRVLIGNRNLMDAHGVKTPPVEVDKKILRSGCFPVYLAVDGQPSCLFVVGYEADPDIAYQLQRLSATGVTLLVDSADPNLSAGMLCDYFGLYGESVKLIPSAAVPLLEQVTEPAEKADAPALYRVTVGGFAALLTAAIRLKGTVTAMTALHVTGMCLGLALAAYFTFAGLPAFVAALPLAAYQLVCTLLTCLVPLIHKA